MKTRALGFLALPFALLAAPSSDAAPSVPAPQPGVVAPSVQRVKMAAKIGMSNVAAVPDEARFLDATLTGKGLTPLAGKTITFVIEPKNGSKVPASMAHAGQGTTDAQGKVHVKWTVPELAGNTAYTMKATWSGDDDYLAATEEVPFAMIKGITKLELSDLLWGYKGEPAAAFSIQLKRTVDGATLSKPVMVQVTPAGGPAGQPWKVDLTGYNQIPLSPLSAAHWKVTVDFAGDDVWQPFHIEKTYVHPPK